MRSVEPRVKPDPPDAVEGSICLEHGLWVLCVLACLAVLAGCGGGRASQGTVYLTFDDGPIDATSGVLDVLAEKGVKATFFVNGFHLYGEGDENEGRAGDALTRLLDDGHVLANHSYDHMLHNCECTQAFVEPVLAPGQTLADRCTDPQTRVDHTGRRGAAVCNVIGMWPVRAYVDLETAVQGFTALNIERTRSRLPVGRRYPNDHLTDLARLPYTNAWRTPGITANCPCCTTDTAPPWHPAGACDPATSSESARRAAQVADSLAASSYQVFGWDLEWSPVDWARPAPAENLKDADAFAADVVEAMTRCTLASTKLPFLSRSYDFPCYAPEHRGRVVVMTHDFLFEDGKRGQGAAHNLPKLRRLIDVLRAQGHRFDTLDNYSRTSPEVTTHRVNPWGGARGQPQGSRTEPRRHPAGSSTGER